MSNTQTPNEHMKRLMLTNEQMSSQKKIPFSHSQSPHKGHNGNSGQRNNHFYKNVTMDNQPTLISNNDLNKDFDKFKRDTVLIDYDKEPDRLDEGLKAKIIEDLNLSSAMKRMKSVQLSKKKEEIESLPISRKVIMPVTVSESIILNCNDDEDEEGNEGTKEINNNNYDDDDFAGQKYINKDMMIIEEEHNNIFKDIQLTKSIPLSQVEDEQSYRNEEDQVEMQNIILLPKPQDMDITSLINNKENIVYTNKVTPTPTGDSTISIDPPKAIIKVKDYKQFYPDNITLSQYNLLKSINQDYDNITIEHIKPDYSKENPYSVIYQGSMINYYEVSNLELVSKRNGIIKNNYFPIAILQINQPGHKTSISSLSNYHNQVIFNYSLIKDQYFLLYITIEPKDKKDYYQRIKNEAFHGKLHHNMFIMTHFEQCYNHKKDNQSIVNTIKSYRLFNSDGDSFYKAFFFAYIEALILNRKQDDLLALFLDILRISECNITANKTIDLSELMLFFSLMRDLVQSGQLKEAYEFFSNVFFNDTTKENIMELLVKYVKTCLYAMQYSHMYDSSTKKGETQKNKSSMYFDEGDGYVIHNIIKSRLEPSRLVFETIPYVFDVKLRMYWIDGLIGKGKMEMCEFEHDLNEEGKNQMVINIGYFYGEYCCVYMKEPYDYDKIFNAVNEKYMAKSPLINHDNKIIGKVKCSKCNTHSIVFNIKSDNHLTNHNCCYQCFIQAINAIISQRTKTYVQEGFLNLEYYTNEITLNILNANNNPINITVSNTRLIQIAHKSIYELFSISLQTTCYSCGDNHFNPQELYHLSCKCNYCKPCLIQHIKSVTEAKVVLNKFELFNTFISNCLCKAQFPLTEALSLLPDQFLAETNEAKNRLTHLVMTCCMHCNKALIKDDELQVNDETDLHRRNFLRFKIKRQTDPDLIPGVDYVDYEHLVCMTCLNKEEIVVLKAKRTKETNEINLNDSKSTRESVNDRIVHCSICSIDHIIDKKDWNVKRDNVCCNQQCVIY